MAQSGARVHLKCVDLYEKLNTFVTKVLNRDVFDMVYPVGSIYMSVNNVDPSTLFGGTWLRIEDRFLLAKGSTYTTLEGTGGSATVSLTQSQMPRHTHTQNSHNHKATSTGRNVVGIDSSANWAYSSLLKIGTGSSGTAYYYPHSDSNTNGITEPSDTGSTTATNKYTGGSGTSESASNGASHENMPPYLVVNVWKRTA